MSTQCLLQPTGINGNFNITAATAANHCKRGLNPHPNSIAASKPSTKSTICIQQKSHPQPQPHSNPPKEQQKQQRSQSQEEQTKLIKKDPIKVQNEFMNAMKNAILRCLDKNTNLSKTEAEKSVFIALGYDPSIESNKDSEKTTEPAPNSTDQDKEYSDTDDEDEDDDVHDLDQVKNKAFLTEIQHYRRHHIMRDRDAIRTFRLKQLHHIITQQYPIYSAEEVLTHLTTKLNILYLPSPSPPPASVDDASVDEIVNRSSNTNEMKNELKIDNIEDNNNKHHANKRKSNNTASCYDSSNEPRKNTKSGHITKEKIINVGYAINRTSNDREDNVQNIVSHKYIAHNDTNQVMIHKANIKDINHKKQQQYKDVSPSSNIYITVKGDSFNNNLSSGASMKCKKTIKPNPAIFGMKKSTSSSSTSSSTLSPSPSAMNQYLSTQNELYVSSLVDRYKANGGYLEDSFFVSPYDNEEDRVIQKMKLHKKSRKRKYDSMNLSKIPSEFEQSLNNFENGQPAKKRTRFGHGNKKKNRAKTNKTTRNRGRKNNRNKYHNLRRNDNHSTDCFDDEEENEQDIDLNGNNTNNLSSHSL